MAEELNYIKKRICMHFLKQKQQPSQYGFKISKFEEELYKQTQPDTRGPHGSTSGSVGDGLQQSSLPMDVKSKASLGRSQRLDGANSIGASDAQSSFRSHNRPQATNQTRDGKLPDASPASPRQTSPEERVILLK